MARYNYNSKLTELSFPVYTLGHHYILNSPHYILLSIVFKQLYVPELELPKYQGVQIYLRRIVCDDSF